MSRPGRVRLWTPWSLVPFAILLVTALGALGSQTRIGSIISAAMALLSLRALLPSGVVTQSKLKVKWAGLLWNRTVRLEDVVTASPEVIDVKFVLVWAPVELSTGERVILRALSGYGSPASDRPNRRVARIAERVRVAAERASADDGSSGVGRTR